MATTQSTNNKSSTVSAKKEYNENEWSRFSRNFELGSAAAKRRTYDGPAYIQSLTTDVNAQSRSSAGSRTSLQTLQTYYTATSYVASWYTAPSIIGDDARQSEGSIIRRTFRRLLQTNGLAPLVDEEYDWCGRGMHVDFKPGEEIPLEVCDSVGHGSTSSVDIVKCRRIKLARKLTYLTHRTDQKVLLKEVQALQKLRHAHVVQLVGTYRQGRKFAALLYPVADMDLAEYLEEARYSSDEHENWVGRPRHERPYRDILSKGSLCLISALRYVHESGVKHMDIKPANILLKKYKATEAFFNDIRYKFYLCDFGIAQVLGPDERSQTETYPGKTPMYASPEVAAYDVHSRASDIFSLGCVLLEMGTVYSGLTVESLKMQIKGPTTGASHSYHTNLDHVRSWISTLDDMKVSNKVILSMLKESWEDRPSLVRKSRVTNIIDLECLHHHDPPDLFEADEVTTATGRGLEPASGKPPLQEQVRDDRISPPKFGASFYS
jgi:serine/threonine protein kinase